MPNNILTQYQKLLEEREFTYVSVYGTRDDEFGKFVIWIAKPHEEVLRRANEFMMRVYGRILESSLYPRTYIRDATDLVRLGLHEEALTADILAFFRHWGNLMAETKRRRSEAQAQNEARIEKEKQNPTIDYSGTYLGFDLGRVPMWKNRLGELHKAPTWMQKFRPGQMFLNQEPVKAIRRRPNSGGAETQAQRAPTVYKMTNELTNVHFCIRLLRKGGRIHVSSHG